MKRIIRYSPDAESWLNSCALLIRNRIVNKIEFFSNQENIYKYTKKLANSSLYRFRIGHYRVIFRLGPQFLDIMIIGKRDEIYK
jgi:mRNA-degrading endonuclease RelE of RelBE toxin-antitoxin system